MEIEKGGTDKQFDRQKEIRQTQRHRIRRQTKTLTEIEKTAHTDRKKDTNKQRQNKGI